MQVLCDPPGVTLGVLWACAQEISTEQSCLFVQQVWTRGTPQCETVHDNDNDMSRTGACAPQSGSNTCVCPCSALCCEVVRRVTVYSALMSASVSAPAVRSAASLVRREGGVRGRRSQQCHDEKSNRV